MRFLTHLFYCTRSRLKWITIYDPDKKDNKCLHYHKRLIIYLNCRNWPYLHNMWYYVICSISIENILPYNIPCMVYRYLLSEIMIKTLFYHIIIMDMRKQKISTYLYIYVYKFIYIKQMEEVYIKKFT